MCSCLHQKSSRLSLARIRRGPRFLNVHCFIIPQSGSHGDCVPFFVLWFFGGPCLAAASPSISSTTPRGIHTTTEVISIRHGSLSIKECKEGIYFKTFKSFGRAKNRLKNVLPLTSNLVLCPMRTFTVRRTSHRQLVIHFDQVLQPPTALYIH